MIRKVAVLGSTGSIGTSTLDVLRGLSDRFEVVSLAAGENVDLLCGQVAAFRPKRVCVADPANGAAERLSRLGVEVLSGSEGLVALASDPGVDLVVNGLVAGVGLRPTIAALEAGKNVATANKETLVVAGEVVTALAAAKGATLVPLDSELTPLWDTLRSAPGRSVRRIILPASGGPFFSATRQQMEAVTPEQALNHPTWKMGPKITIDSATLMNKGFEVIEAHWLFGLPVERIGVVIHRQSIVHCLIEFVDGGLTAHLSTTDMRLPIQQALTHPDRVASSVAPLDLVKVGTLSFETPDTERFPCLSLCYEAIRTGGTAPAVLNGANEVAVASFLAGKVGFLDIPRIVRCALDDHTVVAADAIEAVYEADRWARERAQSEVARMGR